MTFRFGRVGRFFLVVMMIPLTVSAAQVSRSSGGEEIVLARSAPSCEELLTEAEAPAKRGWIKWAAQAGGIVVGGARDVVLTLTAGAVELIPGGLSKWLPLFNEIANVTATATGKRWIYSGVRKRVIDGIALGGIIGGALHAGIVAGPLVGGLNLAVSLGLTYWFPNKYFHSIMQAIPKKLPPRLRARAESPIGQGFIGIAMIVILEQILDHAQGLVTLLPHAFGEHPRSSARAIASRPELTPGQAVALFLIDSDLGETDDEAGRAAVLFWLVLDGSASSALPRPPRPANPEVLLRALSSRLADSSFASLLTSEERAGVAERMAEWLGR